MKYNITVSHEARFIWYRVAKVGTRTILAHLRDSPLSLDIEQGFALTPNPEIRDSYFSFGFVRNPWERLVSCYQNKIIDGGPGLYLGALGNPKGFQAFVEAVVAKDLHACNPHIRLQSALLDLNTIKFVGRYERFAQDLRQIFATLDIPLEEIQTHNASGGGKNFRSHYTPKLVDLVSDAYKRDIQIFGYSFE